MWLNWDGGGLRELQISLNRPTCVGHFNIKHHFATSSDLYLSVFCFVCGFCFNAVLFFNYLLEYFKSGISAAKLTLKIKIEVWWIRIILVPYGVWKSSLWRNKKRVFVFLLHATKETNFFGQRFNAGILRCFRVYVAKQEDSPLWFLSSGHCIILSHHLLNLLSWNWN